MTLIETERLIRKIFDLLQQAGNPAIAPKLAEDFSMVCHATNLRLQQCEAMIKSGDRHQVIQLAETAPNLLDLVTVLEFRGADEWRAYCRQNGLPIADGIDARAVRSLNECYAEGITTDHPLYAAYRRAVLSRNDEEALKALQIITRLNPTDTNAASELDRLDAKVLGSRLHHLGELLSDGDSESVVAEIEAIEAFGFRKTPKEQIWPRAQTVRCGCLLEQIGKLQSESRWLEALSKVDLVRRLQQEFKLELLADSLQRLDRLEAWARAEQEKDRQERQFQALIAELHYRIQQSEEKDTSARYVKLPELRDDYEALNKVWRSLEDFTRPIPENATAGFYKRSRLLEAEIARRITVHRRIIIATGAAVLVVATMVAWLVLGQMRARDLARRLQEAITQRQAHTAERLLEHIRTQETRLLRVGGLHETLAAAETFVGRERGLLSNFEAAFNQLPRDLPRDPDAAQVTRIADQLTLARNGLDALAPDLKTECEPRLQAFERQWQRLLSESGTAINTLLDQWIIAAEKQCGELDYRAPLEKTTGQIANLSAVVKKISDCELGFTNHLSLRSDLLQRSVSVRAKFAAYDHELKKLDDGADALRKARTVNEFSDAINLTASSEFSASPAAMAAADIQSLKATEESTLRVLLGATDEGTWAYIAKGQTTRFFPEEVMPAERKIFEELENEPAISAHHQRCCFWLNREGTITEDWITVGLPERTVGWKKIKAWSPTSAATSVAFADREYGFFDGQFRLSPTEFVYKLDHLGSLKETTSFYSVGLEKVRSGADSYGKPLLEVLDSIKDSREGSPLFRAYLLLRLVQLMNLQPDAWGLTFCPSARADMARIGKIVGGQLNCGDWFLAAKANAYGLTLDQFFESTKSVSYAKQAAGLLYLARAASRTGLRYGGFVGLDRKPHFIESTLPGEIWGYARKQPFSLGGRIEADKPLPPALMPLSPIFALAYPIKQCLAKAGLSADDPSFRGVLPPLFQEATGLHQ